MRKPQSRRHFLASTLAALAGAVIPHRAPAQRQVLGLATHPHPTPRPGIDASKVLAADELTTFPEAPPIFDMIRQIPAVADGIRCHCGCAGHPGFYSLLSCFEQGGMATYCTTCHDEAKLVFDLHQQGKTLDDIRAAVCAKFD